MRRRAALWSLAFALALAGCAVGSPTLAVPLEHNDFGEFSLLVYDASGLISAGRSMEPPNGAIDAQAIARPDDRELDVSWLGGACSHRPTLAVSGDASGLRLVLESPYDGTLPFVPVACPAVALSFGVTLTLSEPVEQAAITLHVPEDAR